ncbi:lysophospholipid acyltransferase 1 isoform X2 [Sceloporus undulatus]|uniref:lysophospholipid acyltransferase 1 isoform X2 n=1 Tax=Sceloporus undulatus TaxID=8520 RepID=UPI001C4D219B|nr:lysophospholipid acyltransferase 1 isoform X2 [Sceloporus undulatus]
MAGGGAIGDPYKKSTGSTLLQPLSDRLDVPLDKVNFFACQFFALLAALWFRSYLSPSQVSSGVRHVIATVLGVCIAIFCCGWYSIHLFVLVMISYGIMTMVSISNIHRYTFTVAMGYLTMCHITRIYIFGYGIVIATFCGPLMMATQKITTLAFQIRDGRDKKAEELTKEQNELVLKRKPSLLEYLSYQLNFLTVLAGPCSNFKDYIAFIEGRHIQMKLLEVNWKQRDCYRLPDPSPVGVVLHKLCITLVWLIVFIILTKSFPMTYLVDDQFISEFSFLSKLGFLYLAVQAVKAKHYFAWTLADAIHNAAGYGFSGVDEKGNFHWDLLTNLNIMNIEMAKVLKCT